MNNLYSTTRSTSSQQMRSHGLNGIELHRVMERREAELQRDHIAAALHVPGSMATVRQWVGDAMIRLGATIAGDAVEAPRMHPQVDAA